MHNKTERAGNAKRNCQGKQGHQRAAAAQSQVLTGNARHADPKFTEQNTGHGSSVGQYKN